MKKEKIYALVILAVMIATLALSIAIAKAYSGGACAMKYAGTEYVCESNWGGCCYYKNCKQMYSTNRCCSQGCNYRTIPYWGTVMSCYQWKCR